MTYPTRRMPVALCAIAIPMLVVASALAEPLLGANATCAAAPTQEECDNLSGCVPDGMTVEGCWACDTDLHVWESIKSGALIGTVTCTSDEGTLDFDFDLPVTWENLFGEPCYE